MTSVALPPKKKMPLVSRPLAPVAKPIVTPAPKPATPMTSPVVAPSADPSKPLVSKPLAPKPATPMTPPAVSKPLVSKDLVSKPLAQTPPSPATGKTGLMPATTTTVTIDAASPAAAGKARPKKPVDPTKGENVADIAAKITSEDSMLMRQARTEGLREANRRGLLSSSMAISAANDSAYRVAVPMASQIASQNFQTNVQLRDIESKEGLAAAQRALDLKLTNLNISSTEKQQLRDIASKEGMAAADRALSKYMQKTSLDADAKQRGLDRALQTELAKWNLDAADRDKAATMLTAAQQLYEQSLATIMANKDLSAEQRTAQVKALDARRTASINAVRSLWDVDIKFPGNASNAPSTSGGKGGGKGGGENFSSLGDFIRRAKIGDEFRAPSGKVVRKTANGLQYV